MIVGVGIDLTSVARMARLLERWGERIEARLFTDGEVAYSRARAHPAQHLAARFSAKEAALKALGGPMGLSWHELEVITQENGQPVMALHGVALKLMQVRGISRLHLSLTHTSEQAAAVVVAESDVCP